MVLTTILGLIPTKGQLLPILLREGIRLGLPFAQQIAQDPAGTVSRIGDVLVWNGTKGQQVLAGLASLSEGQARIEQVVNHIDTVQLGISHTLGVMYTLSIATLGVTSLTGAFMVWRLQSLNKRFDRLSEAIKDVDDHLDAQNKAHLDKAVQKLREFEDSADPGALTAARDEAQDAANIYGNLAWKEASRKQPRIEVLNYRSRCYLLGVMAELQSRILLDQLPAAITRVNDEKPRLQSIAKSTFEAVIKGRPEYYLRADMAREGVTLEVMAELYQQARHAGAIASPEVESAGQLFEHCREKGIAGGSWLFRKNSKQEAVQLRYLMACLEEISRIDGMRLLISEAHEKKVSVPGLREKVREWWKEKVGTTTATTDAVVAYALT
jgi:hypothetical protein